MKHVVFYYFRKIRITFANKSNCKYAKQCFQHSTNLYKATLYLAPFSPYLETNAIQLQNVHMYV